MTWDDAKTRFEKVLEHPKKTAQRQPFFSEKKDKEQVLAIEERARRGKRFLENLSHFREAIEWILQEDTENALWIAFLDAAVKRINQPTAIDHKQLSTCLENICKKYNSIISDEKKTLEEMLGTILLVSGSVAVIAFGLAVIGFMLTSGPLGLVALGGIVAGGIVALVGTGLIIATALLLHRQVEFHKGSHLQEIEEFVDYLALPANDSGLSETQLTS